MRSAYPFLPAQAMLLAIALATSAQAQPDAILPPAQQPAAVIEFEQKLARIMLDYWEPKLNGYKERIDKALLPNDRAELNRLRVRAALLSEKNRSREILHNSVEDGNAEFALAGNDLSDALAMFSDTKTLAAQYRHELDLIGTDVVHDLVGSIKLNSVEIVRFQKEHPGLAKHLGLLQGEMLDIWGDEHASALASEFMEVYPITLEIAVLLYDNTTLATLVEGINQVSGISTGLTLPENSALRQNFPNPASSTTTITYLLAEPSSATTLSIFDARGDLRGTYDRGPLASGEHTIDIDVSDLPSGSYLYRLSVRTERGERTYAKAMQVVR